MQFSLRRVSKWTLFGLLMLLMVFVSKDTFRINVAQQAAASHLYDIVQWEAANFLDKWIHRVERALPWNTISDEEKMRRVEDYFALGEEVNRLRHEFDKVVAQEGNGAAAAMFQDEIDEKARKRRKLRDDVEETIESLISTVVRGEGIANWGEFMFPPVDIRLADTPKLLVTSPRDRIQRTHDVLLESGIKISEREEIESKLLEEENLAALVTNIGGLATFPASLPNDQPLRWTVQTAAHEWLHHYFFFHSLGQNLNSTANMRVLNETMANIAGKEIGDRVFELLGGTIDPPEEKERSAKINEAAEIGPRDRGEDKFDFGIEMRFTRMRTDDLLRDGKIEEAEAFMEERRKLFVENGFPIRKINQAYFAFNGTYADTPGSTNPIGGQLKEFRELSTTLGDFIGAISGISNYQKFLNELEELKVSAATP